MIARIGFVLGVIFDDIRWANRKHRGRTAGYFQTLVTDIRWAWREPLDDR